MTSPRWPVTTTASVMLRRIASSSSRCSVRDPNSSITRSAASSKRCSARLIGSRSSGNTWEGIRRSSSALATKSRRSARRDHPPPSATAKLIPTTTPRRITSAIHQGETAPSAPRTISSTAAGASPSRTAAAMRKVGALTKRLGVEAVADAADGEDQLRIGVVALDMLPQAANMNVDGAWLDERVAAPDHIEQLFARIHAHRMLDEELKQLEFAKRKVLALALDEHLVGAEVHPKSALLEHSARLGLGQRVGAAQESLDACNQFARAEGLHDVIVGAHFESQHFVDFGALGGHDQDRQVRGVVRVAHGAANFEPRHPGQHQVEHHQVGNTALDALKRLRTVDSFLDDKALLRQVVTDEFANVGVVLDDQNPVTDAALGFLNRLSRCLRHDDASLSSRLLVSTCLIILPLTM